MFGRRWLARNLWFLKDIDFYPPTEDARSVIKNADIVVGMGRVVLEALSMGKITVLAGYRDVIGIVSRANFHQYRLTNFSGREIEPTPIQSIVSDTLDQLSKEHLTPSEIIDHIDISQHWLSYARAFNDVTESWTSHAGQCFSDLPKSFCKLLYDGGRVPIEELLGIASEIELEIYQKLRAMSLASATIA